MPEPPEARKFDIPEPPRREADFLAVEEAASFDKEWRLKSTKLEWGLWFVLKLVLFVFVLGLNVYWAHQVIMMLWKSGMAASGFHLSDSVLIALVTTSIANFVALVVIVAKHLFPSGS